MITQEHLEHWLNEIKYQLGGIDSKLGSEDRAEDHSFDYIAEKSNTIRQLVKNIVWDVENDEVANR